MSQFLGLVNTGIMLTVSLVCDPVKLSQVRIDIDSIVVIVVSISHWIIKQTVLACVALPDYYHGDLSHSVPGSFLSCSSSAQSLQRHRVHTGEWWRDVVTVCSLEGTFTLSGSATQLTMSLVGGRVGEL